MCTDTQTLLDKAESTESVTSVFEGRSKGILGGVDLFYDEANELIVNVRR